jgi:hypothetical protein
MGRKYKYCSECGSADDLMHCIQCKKAYHAHCVNLKNKIDSYLCYICVEENDAKDGTSIPSKHKKLSVLDATAIDNSMVMIHDTTSKMVESIQAQTSQSRPVFLRTIKSQLKLLCDDATLTRITLCKKPSSSRSTATTIGKKRKTTRCKLIHQEDNQDHPAPIDLSDLFITANESCLLGNELGTHQHEEVTRGGNTICEFFQRGVGGILTDEK